MGNIFRIKSVMLVLFVFVAFLGMSMAAQASSQHVNNDKDAQLKELKAQLKTLQSQLRKLNEEGTEADQAQAQQLMERIQELRERISQLEAGQIATQNVIQPKKK
ncbi:MAG: FlxA-like family protein [Candidatus Riflebacteria bacterium]|nr:FlxA-like family protein [Candidatus Riflebacteria bacterium]